ncbi:hypothetical protein MCOR25_003682 [Pyricularia grisea]|uniref:Uncharacterized protein n=1 Tax=Pyricularia grisea TaxID=148305 RepID=A0A6P8B3K0_PYRGI|nr:uncharacterized protein PgNI_07444 [Pyricularia grisea]KAI6372716.1 hypothetical protein MCOR25_003682 [Pyricularia grisea]TLD09394.1 hypothetical protein PgNI_07444 [Pyricularia grisea]
MSMLRVAGTTIVMAENTTATEKWWLEPFSMFQTLDSQRISYETDEEALWSLYFAPEQNGTANNTYAGPTLPLLGSFSLYEWKSNMMSLYRKLGYASFAPSEYIYGNQQT